MCLVALPASKRMKIQESPEVLKWRKEAILQIEAIQLFQRPQTEGSAKGFFCFSAQHIALSASERLVTLVFCLSPTHDSSLLQKKESTQSHVD